MKVLHVTKIVGIAGAENYLLKALPGLAGKGIEIEFLCLTPLSQKGNEAEFIQQLTQEGIKIHVLYYQNLLGSTKKINTLVKNGKYDLVHSHLIHADLFMAMSRKLGKNKFKLVSTKHGHDESYMNKNGFNSSGKKELKFHYAAKIAEKQIFRSYSISKGLKQLFVDHGISKEEQMDVIPYGFDFQNEEIKEDPTFRFGPQQLILVGRFTELKGHREAIKALQNLKETYPEIQLLFVGDGYFQNEMKALVKKLELDKHVKFLGYQPNSIEYMASSDVVLIPSKAEGFGLVLLEAYSVKKAVVTFDVPALNEHLKHNETGLLAKPYEVESLTTEIDRLLGDSEFREKIGNTAYKHLKENYSLDKMLTSTVAFYEQCLL